MSVSASSRSRSSTRKLETPIVRARPSLVDAFEGAPGVDEAVLAGHRPVDQVEVDVVEAEPAEARLEGRQRRLVALLGVPQLGGDEEVLAGESRGGDRRADALLVAVGGGGVDMAVAGVERLLDHLLGVLGRHLEDAEAELGDLDAVVEGEAGDRQLGHLLNFLRVRAYSASYPRGDYARSELAGGEADGEQREGQHDAEVGAHRGAGGDAGRARARRRR